VRRDRAPGHVYAVAITAPVLLLLFVATGIAALGAIGSSRATDEGNPSATASKIDPRVIEHTANDQHAELMVVLVDQADLRPAAALATKNEKSRYVHDALWNKS